MTAEKLASPLSTSRSATEPKPRLALFLATAGGLGYFPKGPGTFGSLAGVFFYVLIQYYFPLSIASGAGPAMHASAIWASFTELPVAILLAAAGVWASSSVAKYFAKEDPQFVVIDEVSGQHLTYLLALAPLNWNYLLLGLILFRVFDIWKPFPARQAESLPGGWGIMADDWVAGIYAASGLWIARLLFHL
jgi:phosphatidylglycerophosphatase A